MLDHLKAFLHDRQGRAAAADGRHSRDELQLAAAALLIEAARLDGKFETAERERIATVLERHFSLTLEEVSSLIDEAMAVNDKSVEIYSFVRTINANFEHDERLELIEMMWDVAYADGDLHSFEANLLRRVAGLLYVTDQESGAARRRVLRRAAAAGKPNSP